MRTHCLISEEEVAVVIKGLKIGKAAGEWDDEGSWWFWFKVDD